jgi:hypothetical protein
LLRLPVRVLGKFQQPFADGIRFLLFTFRGVRIEGKKARPSGCGKAGTEISAKLTNLASEEGA